MLDQSGPSHDRRVGVIDIGSNSVRLVIYALSGRSIRTFFNEKFLAGLGRGLSTTGQLDPDACCAAKQVLTRFKAVMDNQCVDDIQTFATAAIRDASDGPKFVAEIKETIGLNIQILSGVDEARLAATGVLAMYPEADGISGDLGGSSLELSVITSGFFTGGTTFALGPLALKSSSLDDAKKNDFGLEDFDGSNSSTSTKMRKLISTALKDAVELRTSADTFYAVGGAWRAFARLHMELSDYPLRLLQYYEMSAQSVLELAAKVAQPDRDMKSMLQNISPKRADNLPLAAQVLAEVVKRGNFRRVVVSSYGVREGIVYSNMSSRARSEDPLLSGMQRLMRYDPVGHQFGIRLADWVRNAAKHTLSPRLVEATCTVADIGWRFHPERRPSMAFDTIVTAPVTGVNHIERACMALAIACRYKRGYKHTVSERLLDGDLRTRARALGALMRLGAVISGRTAGLLDLARLEIEGNLLVLHISANATDLISEIVSKRLARAASYLGLEPEIRCDGVRLSEDRVISESQ